MVGAAAGASGDRQVALNMELNIYEPFETIEVQRLTVITRGLIAHKIRILSHGHVLGDDCIVRSPALIGGPPPYAR